MVGEEVEAGSVAVVPVIGLSGVTNGGKTSLALRLQGDLAKDGTKVQVLSLDDFFREEDELVPVPNLGCRNWDEPSALDFDRLYERIQHLQSHSAAHIIVLEAHSCIVLEEVVFDALERGSKEPRVDGIQEVVWPEYERHLVKVRQLEDIRFLDGASDMDCNFRSIATDTRRLLGQDWVRLCTEPLRIEDVQEFLVEPHTGATAFFLGTTRREFDGKEVVRLEYEAYEAMALPALRQVASDLRQRWPALVRIALIHRLGEVGVGSGSVLVGASSGHRAEALAACAAAIDDVKARVPIWKKERYAQDAPAWKANKECPWAS